MPADVSELEALAAEYKQAGTKIRREQRKVVEATIESIASDAKAAAPVWPTGDLRAPLRARARSRVARSRPQPGTRSPMIGTYKDPRSRS